MWRMIGGTFGDRYRKLEKDEFTKVVIPRSGTVIPFHIWEIDEDPVKLPPLPDLPDLTGTGLPEEELKEETKLIKIAVHDAALIGLTNKGHVLRLSIGDHIRRTWDYVSENTRTIWYLFLSRDVQLSGFSEIDKVKEHPAFRITVGDHGQGRPPEVELSSNTMLITHVSYVASISLESRV